MWQSGQTLKVNLSVASSILMAVRCALSSFGSSVMVVALELHACLTNGWWLEIRTLSWYRRLYRLSVWSMSCLAVFCTSVYSSSSCSGRMSLRKVAVIVGSLRSIRGSVMEMWSGLVSYVIPLGVVMVLSGTYSSVSGSGGSGSGVVSMVESICSSVPLGSSWCSGMVPGWNWFKSWILSWYGNPCIVCAMDGLT